MRKTVRKWKKRTELGEKEEYEIGEAPRKAEKEDLIKLSDKNVPFPFRIITDSLEKQPVFIRKDTTTAFQWRIRNIPYPEDVYSLEVDDSKNEVVIRTSNKKYFKRFQIPDLQRASIKLSQKALSFKHQNNTLVVSYNKPEAILTYENQIRIEMEKLNKKNPKEGDAECTTQ